MDKRSFSVWPFALLGIFVLSVVLYLPSLQGHAIWDDDDLITGAAFGKNTLISAFTKPFLGHYFRPLTSASFVFDSSFAKSTPFLYHQTNIVLHALTAVLVSCLALAVTQKKTAGVLAGLFFATQPLQVGATAWIGGRTDVLSAFLIAAFMVTLVQYHRTSKRGWLVLSAFTFFLAALSKEQTLAILPAVPLSVFAFGSKKWKDASRLCLPYGLALVAVAGLWVLDAPAPYGARSSLFYMAPLALRTASHYGLALLAPNNPSLLTFTLENYRGIIWIVIGAALVGGFGYFLKVTWKDHRPLAWLAVCGLLVYMPISNFPPVPSFVLGPYRFAESGTAAACLLGIGCAYALSHKKYLLLGALAANLVAGTIVCWWGVHLWTTPLALFEKVAETDPHFLVGVGNYSHALDLDNRPSEGLRWTNSTLTWMFGTDKWVDLLANKKLSAFTPEVMDRLRTNGGIPDMKSLGWFISCNASSLARENRMGEAILVEKEALIVGPKDPRIHYAYGQLIYSTSRAEAIHEWEIALKLNSTYAVCAAALAHERVVDGRFAEAVSLLTPVMDSVGWNSEAWIDLAEAKIGLHDPNGATEALNHAEQAIWVKKEKIDKCRAEIQALRNAGTRAHS